MLILFEFYRYNCYYVLVIILEMEWYYEKVAVVTDSNAGIRQKEAKELGIFVLPMPFTIDDQTYYEDINLTHEEFFEKQLNGAEIFTSQPVVGNVKELWDQILKDYDEIVHIPMSSGLSGSCQTAMMLAQEYDNRVFVVDSQRISVTQKYDVIDAKRLADQGKSGQEICDILTENKLNASIYITVNTLDYLKKVVVLPCCCFIGWDAKN